MNNTKNQFIYEYNINLINSQAILEKNIQISGPNNAEINALECEKNKLKNEEEKEINYKKNMNKYMNNLKKYKEEEKRKQELINKKKIENLNK